MNTIKWPFKFDKSKISRLFLPSKAAVQIPQGPSVRIGCDFGKSKILVLEAEKTAEGIRLLKFQRTVRPTDPAHEIEAMKRLFEEGAFSTHKVRIAMKGQGVVVRFVQFPQMKPSELKSAISFEVDQYIPFKAHEVVWDFHILEENIPFNNGTGMNVLLAAVKREELYAMLHIFQGAGLEVELVDIDALAAVNALEYFYSDRLTAPLALLDIGAEVSNLTVIERGKPRFIRDISYGGADLSKRLKRKLGMSHEEAMHQVEVDTMPSPESAAIIKEGLTELVSELQISFNYYQDQFQAPEPIKSLFIGGGGGGYLPIVLETLSTELGFISVEHMNIFSKIKLGPGVDPQIIEQKHGLLSVAMGLAVREI